MGAEAKCALTIGRRKSEGKALLETDTLVFRGEDVRLTIRFTDISSVEPNNGSLRVTFKDGQAQFDIGEAAATWAAKMRNPRSRADKLGIKAGQRVLIVGLDAADLRRDLASRGARVLARAASDHDVIFFAASTRTALSQLRRLRARLKADGALWVIRPKGSSAITEAEVMKAGKAAGLVDVKVVRFSDTHTAEKFVIPVAKR